MDLETDGGKAPEVKEYVTPEDRKTWNCQFPLCPLLTIAFHGETVCVMSRCQMWDVEADDCGLIQKGK